MDVWDPRDKPKNDADCGTFAFYLGLVVGAFTVGAAWAVYAIWGG